MSSIIVTLDIIRALCLVGGCGKAFMLSLSLYHWIDDVGTLDVVIANAIYIITYFIFYYKIYSTRPGGVLRRVSSGDIRNAADWHHIHRNSRHQWHLGKRNGGFSPQLSTLSTRMRLRLPVTVQSKRESKISVEWHLTSQQIVRLMNNPAIKNEPSNINSVLLLTQFL